MDYRPPLAKVRGLGSAKSGTHHWWMQRVTAIVLIPLTLWFMLLLRHLTFSSPAQTFAWLAGPFNQFLAISWIIAVFYHAAMGVQVVIEDYVPASSLKISLVWLVKLVFFALALIAMIAVLRVALIG